MKRHRITSLALAEFSAVRKPAHKGATIDLTKADTRLVLIEKVFPPPGDVHVDGPPGAPGKICPTCKKPLGKGATDMQCAACKAAMKKADDPTTLTEQQMNELEKAEADLAAALAQLEHLKAALAKSEKLSLLTDIEKAHHKRLGAEDAVKFLGMSHSERAEEIKPIYTTSKGVIFTKADDPRTIEMAKTYDEDRKTMVENLEKAQNAGFEARVTAELAHLPGTVQERGALLKAADGIADEKLRTGALTALKAHDVARGGAFQRGGVGQTALIKAGSPEDQLNQLVQKHATDNKVTMEKAWDAVMETEQGIELYSKMEADKAEGRQPPPRN